MKGIRTALPDTLTPVPRRPRRGRGEPDLSRIPDNELLTRKPTGWRAEARLRNLI